MICGWRSSLPYNDIDPVKALEQIVSDFGCALLKDVFYTGVRLSHPENVSHVSSSTNLRKVAQAF